MQIDHHPNCAALVLNVVERAPCNCINGPAIERMRQEEMPMFSQAAVASQTPLDLDAPLPTPAKRGPKNSDRAQHKRKAPRTPTTATLDIRGMESAGSLVLVVSDVLTKNDRYGRGKGGTFEKTASKWFKAAVARAAHAHGFTEPYRIPEIKKGPNKRKASTVYGTNTIQSGLWSLEVLSIWPHQRHLEGAGELANGDADAPLSMVRDAMQRAGIIDDDMRIVSDRTLAIYRKDERRTIARLTRIDGPALQRHHNAIESLLLAELLADNAAAPAAC